LDDGDSSESRIGTIEKSLEALEHKSVVMKLGKHKVVVFTKAPPQAYSEPFMRFPTPCGVDGQEAWDAELDFAYSYITYEMLGKLGFIRLDNGNYGRRMVKEVRIEIHGFNFLVDFMVIDYANKGEPSVVFGRDFLEKSIAAIWLEKVVTPLIVPAIKGFVVASAVLKPERLKVDEHDMSEPMSYYLID
nr:hypothetical protein [Tanacetum cinerariifolium]